VNDAPHGASRQQEEVMAKSQMKGNKEAKKPKADKNRPKGAGSAYKQSQIKGDKTTNPFAKKT
jgi:hypothetical protein